MNLFASKKGKIEVLKIKNFFKENEMSKIHESIVIRNRLYHLTFSNNQVNITRTALDLFDFMAVPTQLNYLINAQVLIKKNDYNFELNYKIRVKTFAKIVAWTWILLFMALIMFSITNGFFDETIIITLFLLFSMFIFWALTSFSISNFEDDFKKDVQELI